MSRDGGAFLLAPTSNAAVLQRRRTALRAQYRAMASKVWQRNRGEKTFARQAVCVVSDSVVPRRIEPSHGWMAGCLKWRILNRRTQGWSGESPCGQSVLHTGYIRFVKAVSASSEPPHRYIVSTISKPWLLVNFVKFVSSSLASAVRVSCQGRIRWGVSCCSLVVSLTVPNHQTLATNVRRR